MKNVYILVVLVSFVSISKIRAESNNTLIVNIDNPNFRRLIVAVPSFIYSKEDKNPATAKLAETGGKDLGRLLVYSGLFNVISESAYKDLLKNIKPQADSQKQNPKDLDATSLQGIDLVQWKAIGVESLTVGNLESDQEGFTLSIRTVDISRGSMILGKKYSRIKESEFPLVIRRYADLLLKAYTGKTGIFSSKIVFIGRKYKRSDKQVYICDFDGSNVVQITRGNYPHLSPQWSPDGRFVSFTSYEHGGVNIYSYEVSTGKKVRLSNHAGINSGANWAANGKLIAYTGSVRGDADIYTISTTGGPRSSLIKGSGLDVDPAFSPDLKWMAFVSGRYGNPHIFRAALEWTGDNQVKVTADKRLTYAGWYNATPSWSPDSGKIAFAGYDKDIDRFDLFMMGHDGKNLERLTIRAGDNESPSWSPNGQLLIFQSNRIGTRNIKGIYQLYLMNRDGSNQRPINVGLYEAQTPSWSTQIE